MAYNRYDSELPWPMVRAAQLLKYDPGESDISVTTLIGPARIRLLKEHPDFVPTEDIQDKGYAFGGTIMHHIMQLAADPNSYIVFEKMKELFTDFDSPNAIVDEFKDLCAKMWGALQADRIETKRIVEKRYYIERAGIKIGGQIDYTEPDLQLWDYKMMSVWEAIFGINFEKEAQANLYRHILREHDIHIKSLHIAAFLRDWKLKDAESGMDKNYPVKQIVSFPILTWEPERVEKFIQQRLNAHYGQKDARDPSVLPKCNDSEVWHQKKRWAVMRRGYDRAQKVCYSHEDALEYQGRTGKGDYIEFRPEQYTRCQSYCEVSHLCEQWAENKKRMDRQIDMDAPSVEGAPYG